MFEFSTVSELFHSPQAFDDDARVYLIDRSISIPVSLRSCVSGSQGWIHFGYKKNNEIVGFKSRKISEKKYNFTKLNKKEDIKYPFFNQTEFSNKEYLVVTEGEFDALALIGLGVENVVSLPFGCNSVESTFRDNYAFLSEFRQVYICFDQDDPGRKAAQKAQGLIPLNKYRNIRLPAKDANDWVIQDNPDFNDFINLMDRAEKVSLPEAVNGLEIWTMMTDLIDVGISTGFDSLDKILGGIRRSELTIVAAETGAGKTTFCMNLLYHLANQNHACWMNSFEMYKDTVLRKLASIHLGRNLRTATIDEYSRDNFQSWLNKHLVLFNPQKRGMTIDSLRKSMEIVKYTYDVEFVFLDHLDYISLQERRSGDYEDQKNVMIALHDMAAEFNLGIILVTHTRKSSVEPGRKMGMWDIKGSSSIQQYADNILFLTRNNRNDPNDSTVSMQVCKNRLFGKEGTIRFNYDPIADRFEDMAGFNFKTEFEKTGF